VTTEDFTLVVTQLAVYQKKAISLQIFLLACPGNCGWCEYERLPAFLCLCVAVYVCKYILDTIAAYVPYSYRYLYMLLPQSAT